MANSNQLKVAHFAVFSPGRSGQYATVRDLILAERGLGIDAQFIDSETCLSCKGNKGYAGRTDGPIITMKESWAESADVLVRHSIIPEKLEDAGIPIVCCLHGRPENSFLLDQYGKIKVFHFLHQLNSDPRYQAIVTFWEEFKFHFKYLLPKKKVSFVPAMVKLDEYTPHGRTHEFGKKSGSPNIIICDVWREDVTPFNLVFAALKFQEEYAPDAKLHIFGLPPQKNGPAYILVNYLIKHSIAGDFYALMPDMMEKYRAADFLITPHNMATRVVREALACGCPVVGGTGNPYTQFTADARDINQFAKAMDSCWKSIESPRMYDARANREEVRKFAEKKFNSESAGKAMLKVFKEVIADKKKEITAIHTENKEITFAIAAYNSNYIEQINVALQSIDKIYKGSAGIILYYSNIDKELIDEIKTILPYVITKESKKADCELGDDEYKTAMKSIVWSEILEDHPKLTNVVFMDADTLLLRKMGKFFIKEFDVGYCYKLPDDENPHWPINGGVMLIKNSKHSLRFLKKWGQLTVKTQENKLSKVDGYNQWGGGDQVSLGLMLGTRKQLDYQDIMIKDGIKLLGFPMAFFNESRGLKPSINTHIVHYKSKSWQNLLKSGIFTPRRPQGLCQILYDLYHTTLREWQYRRHQTNKSWTPEFELVYWTAHEDEFYLKDVERLHKLFNVDKIIKERFGDCQVQSVIDVGGGAYGGELYFYKDGAIDRILYDYIADEYERMGKVPTGIKCVKGDFATIPYPDNSFDVVFAWEVLDHALSVGHFKRGQAELIRILKPNGLMFFNHPLFSKPKPGHTIVLTMDVIMEGFSNLKLMDIGTLKENVKADLGELCCILSKPSITNLTYNELKLNPPSVSKPMCIQTSTNQIDIIELREIDINSLKVQYNLNRVELYKSIHNGPENELHNMKFSPHVEFLLMCDFFNGEKLEDHRIRDSRYYKMHKVYGKTDKFAYNMAKSFILLAKDIKQNSLKVPPIVFDNKDGTYEIFEGHHRIAVCRVLNQTSLKVAIGIKK